LPNDDRQNDLLREWLAGVARRDAAAFRRLYEFTSPKLFGLALRILRKQDLAEDVLQESFVSVWNNSGRYQAELAAPMTWLTTIVRNKAFDALRRRDDTEELDSESFDKELMNALESTAPGPAEKLRMSAEASALAHCMSRLQGLHRQAIALAYFHDLSHSEVAAQLKLPIGTVKTWIRRGLESLRGCLGEKDRA
jgi:RNA polymerase sigma factor (sigma-70 family)